MDIGVRTRPVRPDDGPRFCRLWSRLSPETVYRRFHAPLRRPPVDALPHLVAVDHDLREALVAEVGGEVVGVARYDRSPADPATAEVAVVVEDGWQGVGVGRQLLRELVELAGRRGVATLTADVQVDNDRVVGLVRRLLPGASLTAADGVYAVSAPVARVPAPVGA
ncbi:GNAT family N-acetyltransferase [Geodermatophilus sp. SYSU D00965]